ncbi:MAG TPA: hypothetical protein VFO54_09125 [Chryseosolibacter sp.]|nr:hypothetical protein [Chryseosolibacter sp.]
MLEATLRFGKPVSVRSNDVASIMQQVEEELLKLKDEAANR